MRAHSLLALTLFAGCAAQPGRPPLEELQPKSDALVGATCVDDSGCDAWEHCDRLVCITHPCPSEGTCRNITRWYDNDGADIPDADPSGVARVIRVERPASTVTRAFVGVNIRHPWRGDLRVTLRSPAGTEHVLHDRAGRDEDDLSLGVDLTRVFEGETAVGDWTLVVSDHARRDVGRLLTWRLELDYAEDAPPPPPGRDLWADVVVPAIESEHPYANDTDRTWDLRPFSGGAARARITFARLDVERGYDEVQILDMSTGAVLDTFTGDLGGFTTREYATGDLGVRLLTDYSVTGYGLTMAHVEVFGLGCLDDEDCGEGFNCPDERVRCIRFPCFLTCEPGAQGGEGEGCAGNADCRSDLYCGADGFCRRDGACLANFSECDMPGNDWARPRCLGHGACDAGQCRWSCGAPAECTDGDRTDDGCNQCTCSGGMWACTERYCPPTAGAGETCGAGTICEAGLTCDQGRAPGATCSSDRLGVCVSEAPSVCTAEHAPVCACTGQTFSNDCRRVGVAPYAHDGACALDRSIPDADPSGVTATVQALAPAAPEQYVVTVRVDHPWRGDLVVYVVDPDGRRQVLTNREGGSADDFTFSGAFDVGPSGGHGTYTLHVSDRATYDVGVLRFFNVVLQ